MGAKYLIDTNILLEFLANALPEKINGFINEVLADDFNISIINLIEVLGHSSATKDMADFLELATQFDLTQQVVQETIKLRIKYKIKLPDAIIAATAIVNDFILLSRNTKDFDKIGDLKLLNPYSL